MATRRQTKIAYKQEISLKPNIERKAIPAAPIAEIKVQIPGLCN
jgi:hypothetical protein